jgi:hypothetical protein
MIDLREMRTTFQILSQFDFHEMWFREYRVRNGVKLLGITEFWTLSIV